MPRSIPESGGKRVKVAGDNAPLCPCQEAAIAALIRGPSPWTSAEKLASGDEETRTAITEGLSALAKDGLAETWDRDKDGTSLSGGPYVTLTPAGACRASAVLVEHTEQRPRWRKTVRDKDGSLVRVEELLKRPIRAPRSYQLRTLQFPELVPDRCSGPEHALDEGGEPLTLFAEKVPVLIDKRLRRGLGKAKRHKKRA